MDLVCIFMSIDSFLSFCLSVRMYYVGGDLLELVVFWSYYCLKSECVCVIKSLYIFYECVMHVMGEAIKNSLADPDELAAFA